jgi:hypothetical protein
MASCEINDIRSPAQFRGISFSKYKKTEVKTQLIQSMLNGKIEHACNWCAELVCAGHYAEAWENILYFMSKYIHLGNPKIPIYLEMRYAIFRNIMNQGHYLNELELRNNEKIRKLFAEIVCILTLSPKKPSFEAIKINRVEEFDITQLSDRLKAPNVSYAESVFKKDDPKELFIAVNEFAYSISSDSLNMINACYWIEWIIEFDSICRNRKEPCHCEKRSNYNVESKYQRDIIWLIWDAILYSIDEKNTFIQKIMNALMNLFCVKYTTASCKKRRYILYYAVELFTESVNTTIEIIDDKTKLEYIIENIDEVYKQIKKNEDAPKTEYLFKNIEKQKNLEKSLLQMELVNSVESGNLRSGIRFAESDDQGGP